MKIVEAKMYKGHLYEIVFDGEVYLVSWDCGAGVGDYRGAVRHTTLGDAIEDAQAAIDCYVNRHVDDILLFGDEIKVGARLYSHETNEKCTVTAFDGSSMTVEFDNGDTQEFGSDYAFDVIYDFKAEEEEEEDGAQYDIVCEGHTRNGMKFQIITDSQHKDNGYGFAVDIWNCFEQDYTKYRWNYSTLQEVVDTIESEYSKDKDKLELLKPGEYSVVRWLGSDKSELILVRAIDKDTVHFYKPGQGELAGDLSLIVPLSAEVLPWTAEEMQSHAGCLFRCGDYISMAIGYSDKTNTLNIAKVTEVVTVSAVDLINHGYEVKTDEGWKPCYNVKWKE